MAKEEQAIPEVLFHFEGPDQPARRLKLSLFAICHINKYLREKTGDEKANLWEFYKWGQLSPEDVRELIWAFAQTKDSRPSLEEISLSVDAFDALKFGGILVDLVLQVVKQGVEFVEGIAESPGIEELQKKMETASKEIMNQMPSSKSTSSNFSQ